jgi:hypothetical protein
MGFHGRLAGGEFRARIGPGTLGAAESRVNRLTVTIVAAFAFGALAIGTLPASRDVPGAAAFAQPVPSPTESAIIEIQEGPASSSPTPSATPSPTPQPRRNGRSKATPTPSPAPSETETPTPEPTPEPASTAFATTAPSPVPTFRPTTRPLVVHQPTIPQTLDDPDVQAMLRRSIALLSSFNWMTGTWHAHNFENVGDGQQRDLGTNTYVFAQTMKGRWIFGADGKASDYFYITYDPFAEHWALVRMNVDPSYGIWISERGWRGNSIEFTSTYAYALGRPYQRRTTIVRKGPKAFGMYDEEQLPDGSWTSDDSIELTK